MYYYILRFVCILRFVAALLTTFAKRWIATGIPKSMGEVMNSVSRAPCL
jgi:hypothetical protein